MNDTQSEETMPIRVKKSLHTKLKIKAAQLGKKLGAMAEDKLAELVAADPAISAPQIGSHNSEKATA